MPVRNIVYVVRDDGEKIMVPPMNEVVNHSPDGFEWGYGGSGPAQLAFAILCCYSGEFTAQIYYQDFKNEVIQHLHNDTFTIEERFIDDWLDGKGAS